MNTNDKNSTALIQWNRTEVNRYLLPVLRYLDSEQNDTVTDEERDERKRGALESTTAYPEAYRQLSHVYHDGSDKDIAQWFGWIQCSPELLESAFDFIDDNTDDEKTAHSRQASGSFDKDLYFMQLFHITDEGESVDLAYPFEQYYYCDAFIYKDYLLRRLELADKCKAWIRHYLPYYTRIRAWYVEHGGAASGISMEYCTYMELLDYFSARISYEDKLRDERQDLEYQRGGLGWFNRRKKRKIDERLHELVTEELKMHLDDAKERYTAYEAQFADQREKWELELDHIPWTAFVRKKELKEKLDELKEKLNQYRASLGLDELEEEYNKRRK